MKPKYHIYPTLLDAFAWYKKSEQEDPLTEFLNKINRVEVDKTDPMLRGIAFNNLVDAPALPELVGKDRDCVMVHDTLCPVSILETFRRRFVGAIGQVFVETVIETIHGPVRIYGFIDELLEDTCYEIKTCSKYDFPKYLHNWQHPTYLECLKNKAHGVNRFLYMATDFKNIFEEEYHYQRIDTDRLISATVELVEFIESKRDLITDKKLFGLV